jgi:hypothetical protein
MPPSAQLPVTPTNTRAFAIRAHNRTPITDHFPGTQRTRAHSRNVDHHRRGHQPPPDPISSHPQAANARAFAIRAHNRSPITDHFSRT